MRRVVLAVLLSVAGALVPLPWAHSLVPVAALSSQPLTAAGGTVALAPGTTLVGLVFDQPGEVAHLRVRTGGLWGPWRSAGDESGADGAEARRVRPGSEPVLVSSATAVQVRRPTTARGGARLVSVRDEVRSIRASRGTQAHALSTGEARLGDVTTRREWGADESLVRSVEVMPDVDAVVVHHTVSRNDYAAADVPAMLRAIHAFHVRGRGFDDLAYNAVVDRFGRVFEGRRGSFGPRTIRGGHTSGFNRRTFGVSFLGDSHAAEPGALAVEAIARVATFAADRWGFDPRGDTTLTSSGGSRYRDGARVRVPRVVPHRTLVATACPGQFLVPRLPAIVARSWRLLAPVVYGVVVEGAPVHAPDPVRVRARLTSSASWRISVTDVAGLELASSTGRGAVPELIWDGRFIGAPAVPGSYRYTVTADDGIHGLSDPLSGSFDVGLPRLS